MIQQHPSSSSQSRQYFLTELSLISQLLNQQISQSKHDLQIINQSSHKNEQQDISQILIKISQTNQKTNTNLHIDIKITIIQIQTCIKFHVVYRKNQYVLELVEGNVVGQDREIMVDGKYMRKLKESFQYVDQFWINYRNYLPKRVYQGYRLSDLQGQANWEKTIKLRIIFKERVINQIAYLIQPIPNHQKQQQRPQAPKPDPKTLLITAISQNYPKLSQYLTPKQYKNLRISTRQLYKILTNQQNYKILFELKWGRTGFDLDQKDWIKMYKNKMMELYKSKKNGFREGSRSGFFWI